MDFRVLGPLEVAADGRQLPLGGGRQRAVLAVLLLHRGEVVSFDRMVDELWGERPPETAVKTVQVYVSRLRRVLGQGVLETRGGGYVLLVGPDEVDADRFEQLAREGRRTLDAGDARGAAQLFRTALDLWRGAALDDFAYEEFARNEIARLEDLRLSVLEDRIDADLDRGRHAALVPEVESLVAEHPTRERLRGQLMLALYRSGRQAEALESYRDARRALDRDLGLEPGPELQQMERAILTQDPALTAPPRRDNGSAPARHGGILLLVGGGLLLAAAVAAVIAITADGGSANADAPANSLAVIDPISNDVVTTVPMGLQPADVAPKGDSVWVANAGDDSVTEVDTGANAAVGTTSPGVGVAGLAAGAGAVWVGTSRGSEVVRMDPVVGSIRSIRLAPGPGDLSLGAVSPVAVGYGSVWVVSAEGAIARLDPERGQVVGEISAGNSPSSIATGAGAVWVTDDADNTVSRIDPTSANAVTATAPVGQGPTGVAVGAGAVWVANTQDDTVARIDPETAGVVETIPVGARPTGIAADAGAVWVANSLDGTVSRIDPETNRVDTTIDIGEAPQEVAVADGRIWVSVDAEATVPETPSDGSGAEAARLLLTEDPGPDDPAVFANVQIAAATCALLYNYPDKPFPAGAHLRPEVAQGQPAVSDDGRTYTFRLRAGFRFSPPSNEPVTAAAFERAIERVLDPRMGSGGRHLLRDVVGAKAYMAGRSRRLAGVTARGDELVIRLTKPVPNLPERFGAPYFCAVPPDTPIDPEGSDPLPSAGPYYVASHIPDRSLVLVRNPNYGGSRPSDLPEMQFAIGTSPEDGVGAVEDGSADYFELQGFSPQGGVAEATERRLTTQYGPQSEAARAGNQQLFTQPIPAVFSFAFNTVRGPFADVDLRRAVNYAIDRRALAADTGLGLPGRPTDQYIPPGIPGFEDAQIYPLGAPDLAKARRLAGGGSQSAVLYTCSTASCTRQAQILRSNLSAIGIDLEVHQFPIAEMFAQILGPGGTWDMALWGWIVDYADPFDYINTQFAADAEHPGGFQDSTIERRLKAASRLAGDARLRAYARLDRDLAEQFAPQATFASAETSYFLSARMGCQVLHPIYGLDLAALCIDEE